MVNQELESRIEQNGEVIQFTESRIRGRTLHEEFDDNSDYREFKMEELGELKVELDHTVNELSLYRNKNTELEDSLRRLRNEYKSISTIHQQTDQRTGLIKMPTKNVHTNTPQPKKASLLEKLADYILAIAICLFSIMICLLMTHKAPWLVINCPGVGPNDYF